MPSPYPLLHGAAVGVAILLGTTFWKARPRSAFAWVGVMFAVGAVAYQVWIEGLIPASLPLARLMVGLAAVATPFFFWSLVRFIFEDGFALRPVHWAMLAVVEAIAVGYALARHTGSAGAEAVFGAAFRLLLIGIVAHALYRVWVEREVDLVEERISLRRLFVIIVGGTVLYELGLALVYAPAAQRPIAWQLSEASVLLLANLFLASRLLELNHYFLGNEQPHAAGLGPSLATAPSALRARSGKPAAEGGALDRLETLMSKEYVWRETGLSIGGLADRMRMPEYRLRKLINEQLGYRNFTAFLNEYRLAAAAERLADVAEARTPILTIALDLGWASIGPFNRAFRAKFGTTPSDFRQRSVPADGRSGPSQTSPNL